VAEVGDSSHDFRQESGRVECTGCFSRQSPCCRWRCAYDFDGLFRAPQLMFVHSAEDLKVDPAAVISMPDKRE
jgi:hypothetical protein